MTHDELQEALEPVVRHAARLVNAETVFMLVIRGGQPCFSLALGGVTEVEPARVRAVADKLEEAVAELRKRANLMQS